VNNEPRYNETVAAGLERFPFFVQQHERVRKSSYHTQPGIEIDITCKGRATLVVGHSKEVMVPRQVVIVSGDIPHQIVADESAPYLRTVICIDPARLSWGNAVLEALLGLERRSWILDMDLFREIDRLCADLDVEMREEKPDWEISASGIVAQVLVHLRRSTATQLLSSVNSEPPKRNDLVQDCRDYIRLHKDEAISLSSLAEHFFVSPGHLARRFRHEVGMTVHEYILSERLSEAKRLLATQRDLSITEIAMRVGFLSVSHFSRTFHQHVGHSPLAYRKQADPV